MQTIRQITQTANNKNKIKIYSQRNSLFHIRFESKRTVLESMLKVKSEVNSLFD